MYNVLTFEQIVWGPPGDSPAVVLPVPSLTVLGRRGILIGRVSGDSKGGLRATMWTNRFKQQLKSGRPSVGTWVHTPAIQHVTQVDSVGFDWVVVDMEHSPMDMESVAAALATFNTGRTTPLVRVPTGTVESIKRALDAGAWGVMAPMVNSRADAEAVIAAAKFPPLGLRSAGAYATTSMGTDPATYYERANDELAVLVQVEHIQAVERLDEILDVPGIDCVFVGPGDLCASLGLKIELDSQHPRFIEATQVILDTCARRGVPVGIMVLSAESANAAIERGFRMIALATDGILFARLARKELEAVRR